MTDGKNILSEPVVLGALRGSYGLKGWVKIQPFQDGDALLETKNWYHLVRGEEPQPVEMEQAKFHGSGIVAKIKGIDTPEAAAAFKGAVGLLREDFPETEEDEYYWVDLIGCTVVNTNNETIGTVKAVTDNGAHDVLDVKSAEGKSYLIPFVENYIEDVDLEEKKVIVDWSLDWV